MPDSESYRGLAVTPHGSWFYMGDYYQDNRAWVKGLAMGCPFEAPLPDCPLEAIRKLVLVERHRRVNVMTDEELTAIVSYHKECLSLREAELME